MDVLLLFALLVAAPAATLGGCAFSGRRSGAGVQRLSSRQLLQAAAGQPCAPSDLGYQCTALVCGRIRIHWSLGGPPPTGPGCFYTFNGTLPGTPDASAQLLHVALQTDALGYVAASWPKHAGVMAPADGVVGFARGDGSASVRAYSIEGWEADSVQPDPDIDITNAAVDKTAGSLTICFSRNVTQMGTHGGITITPTSPVSLNFVASVSPFKQMHSLRADYKCTAQLLFAAATGGPDDGGWRPSVNATSHAGDDTAIEHERLGYIRLHGSLELIGWLVMVPAGILAARHRWLFARFAVTGLWFQVHRIAQGLAVLLVVCGFILPFTSFDSNDTNRVMNGMGEAHHEDSLVEAHENMAITLIAVLGVHVLLALLRPKPDAPRRRVWNLVHWWTGRGLVLLAGINVSIGASLYARVSGGSGAGFIVPLVLLAAGWLGAAAWLERQAPEDFGRDAPLIGGGAGGGGSSSSTSGDVALGDVRHRYGKLGT